MKLLLFFPFLFVNLVGFFILFFLCCCCCCGFFIINTYVCPLLSQWSNTVCSLVLTMVSRVIGQIGQKLKFSCFSYSVGVAVASGEEVPGSIPAVAARSLLAGSVSVGL